MVGGASDRACGQRRRRGGQAVGWEGVANAVKLAGDREGHARARTSCRLARKIWRHAEREETKKKKTRRRRYDRGKRLARRIAIK